MAVLVEPTPDDAADRTRPEHYKSHATASHISKHLRRRASASSPRPEAEGVRLAPPLGPKPKEYVWRHHLGPKPKEYVWRRRLGPKPKEYDWPADYVALDERTSACRPREPGGRRGASEPERSNGGDQ